MRYSKKSLIEMSLDFCVTYVLVRIEKLSASLNLIELSDCRVGRTGLRDVLGG